MIVGVLTVDLFFPHARSLKDKRRILHGLKERLKGRHNVAVAELDFQDKWQRARLGIVTVNSQASVVEDVLARILADARGLGEGEVVGHEVSYL
ncbi:MAG TPA: DUF503 domain-containing protein [Terriglobales bacterium]|nr:DUF503 domain-containing protein [Terriglobales bacterium]